MLIALFFQSFVFCSDISLDNNRLLSLLKKASYPQSFLKNLLFIKNNNIDLSLIINEDPIKELITNAGIFLCGKILGNPSSKRFSISIQDLIQLYKDIGIPFDKLRGMLPLFITKKIGLKAT